MKKFVYLIAALFAVSVFASCSKDYVGGKGLLIGTWERYKVESFDPSGNPIDYRDDVGQTYNFRRDGTLIFNDNYGNSGIVNWAYDKSICAK